MFQIKTTTEVTLNGIKTLVYGGPGVGKTRLISTAPYPLVLSCEGGLLSLRKENVHFIEIKYLNDLQNVYNWLYSGQDNFQYWTIGLDSTSEIIEVVLNNELQKTRDPRQAYGAILNKGTKLLRDFRDLPYRNVVMICKQEWVKNEQTGAMHFAPSFPGAKLGPNAPYFPDEVFQLEIHTHPQTHQRIPLLRCWPSATNVAKDRSGALNEFEPPDLGYVFSKILGS